MRRRDFIALLAGAATGWAQLARGQAKALPRVCLLTFDPQTMVATRFSGFFEGLRDLGYIDGRTIAIDVLSVDGQAERYPALATECLRRKADVIVVTTTPGAQAAKNVTTATPIVLIGLGDPVGTGLVDSLARPSGNVTGLSQMAPELAAKRLALLREMAPQISRVLVLTYLADPIAPPQIRQLEAAAKGMGIQLLVQNIRTAEDLPAAFDAGTKGKAQGLVTTGESIFVVNRQRVVELAARHKLPAVYPLRLVADAGGLMSYDSVRPDLHRRAATYVDKILKGAKPAALPIEQPTKFELVANLKTARDLAITIPQSFLQRADRVIQ